MRTLPLTAAALAWLALPSGARAASLTSAGPGLVVDDRGSAAEARALKRSAASRVDASGPFDPDRVAPILAHELLGHSLPLLKADKAGLGRRVFARFDGNEVYACLVDAAVSLEIRDHAYESQAASLMRSTEAYMADIRFLSSG